MAFSYPKSLFIHQITTFNQQLTSKLWFQIIYTWPFISHSITKPQSQKVHHPKQSTFRAILPLFAVVEPAHRICNYQFDETLAPQTDPKKIISQHVGLQRWNNGTWKKRRETSISLTGRTAECWTLYGTGLWHRSENHWDLLRIFQ